VAREWTQVAGRYIDTPDIPMQNGAARWSIAGKFWPDIDTTAGANMHLYQGSSPANRFVQTFWNNGGSVWRTRWDINSTNHILDATTSEVTVGQWNHYAGTYDGSNVRVYIEAKEIATSPVAATGGMDDMSGFRFGNNSSDGTPFDGKLAEWSMWDVDLSLEDISLLKNGMPPSLVKPTRNQLYLQMLGYTNPERDLSGHGFNGRVTGSVPQFKHPPIYRQLPISSTIVFVQQQQEPSYRSMPRGVLRGVCRGCV